MDSRVGLVGVGGVGVGGGGRLLRWGRAGVTLRRLLRRPRWCGGVGSRRHRRTRSSAFVVGFGAGRCRLGSPTTGRAAVVVHVVGAVPRRGWWSSRPARGSSTRSRRPAARLPERRSRPAEPRRQGRRRRSAVLVQRPRRPAGGRRTASASGDRGRRRDAADRARSTSTPRPQAQLEAAAGHRAVARAGDRAGAGPQGRFRSVDDLARGAAASANAGFAHLHDLVTV